MKEKIPCISISALGGGGLGLEEPSLVILADVPAGGVPAAIRDRWSRERVPLVLVGSDSLDGWTALPGFPLGDLGETSFIGGEAGPPPSAAPASVAVEREPFMSLEIEAPPVDVVRRARPAPKAAVIWEVRSASGPLPMVVADSWERPRCVAILADTTWKWALDPRAGPRAAHRAFWTSLVEWLREKKAHEEEIVLRPEPPGEDGEVRGVVEVAGDEPRERLAGAVVAVEEGPEVRAEAGEGGRLHFRLSLEADPLRPVRWLQARGEIGGREVSSGRVPVVLRADREELRDVRPAPDVLRAHTTGGEGSFAWFPDRAGAISPLFRRESLPGARWTERRRDAAGEVLLAAVAGLLLAAEWWLERRLRRRRSS